MGSLRIAVPVPEGVSKRGLLNFLLPIVMAVCKGNDLVDA